MRASERLCICTRMSTCVCCGIAAALKDSWEEISFTTSMKSERTKRPCEHTRMYRRIHTAHSVAPIHISLMSIKSPENSIWQDHACYQNTGNLAMCTFNFQWFFCCGCFLFSCVWTIILRSYRCSSLVPSSWAGRCRCLTLGDRCHVPNTAPDRLAAGHRSSLPPSPQSTRTPHARTRRARRTEGLHSPLRTEGRVEYKSTAESEVKGRSEGEGGQRGPVSL